MTIWNFQFFYNIDLVRYCFWRGEVILAVLLISLNNVCVSLSLYFEIYLFVYMSVCLLIGLYLMCVVHKETRNGY